MYVKLARLVDLIIVALIVILMELVLHLLAMDMEAVLHLLVMADIHLVRH
jgi:hypothetical protein